jgi:hypothetical protein
MGQDGGTGGARIGAVRAAPAGEVDAGRSGNALPCPEPPANIEGFVQVLGEDGAAAFLLRFGGATLNLSANPRGGSAVADLVGLDAASALGRLQRRPDRIPVAKQWLTGYLLSRGYPVAEIARTLRVTDVTVRRFARRVRERAEQGKR